MRRTLSHLYDNVTFFDKLNESKKKTNIDSIGEEIFSEDN